MKKSVRDKLYARLANLNKVELGNLLQHLDRERNLLSSIFNLLQESIVLVDKKGNTDFFNESASRFLAFSKDHKQVAPLWHWLPALKSFFDPSNNGICPDVLSKEMELIYPEKKWVRIHIQIFPENNDNPRFIVLIQDITAETEENEERLLQERFDSVVQLASEVAHELGNPLNSMGIHLQLIQRTLRNMELPPNIAESLSVCQSEVKRLDEIIQHFLKAVRPRAVSLKKENIVPIIHDVLSLMRPQLENLGICVDIQVQDNLSLIFLDKARVHQALFNVIKNATEAIGNNGWIKISCYQNDCQLIVACADSGSGISGEQAATMMSSSNYSSKHAGQGIGMLIVRRVMREHHGCVELESKEKLGSILYLKFPLPEQNLRKLPNRPAAKV